MYSNPTTGEITFTPVPGYTSDPDNIDYILTENATGLSDTVNVLITYLEASPFANDDSSLGNAVGTNATVNLFANDQLSDGSQATTTNTSVILIDPATGMPTVTPNVVTIPGQGVCTYNPCYRRFDLWSVWWLYLQILHQSVISLQKHWTGLTESCFSDNYLYWTTTSLPMTIAHWAIL